MPHAYIDGRADELVASLQAMVRIATVNPPGDRYGEMVDHLQRRCLALGLAVAVHRVPDALVEAAGVDPAWPRCNLVGRWDVGAPRTVHFNAHYDVVPTEGQWKFGDPFEPCLAKGALYGRGSSDMKGSIAALLMALQAVRDCRRKPVFNIELSFTADEETGGELGAGYLVRQGLVKADWAVVCEGASGMRVGCGHNGVLWLDVEVKGRSAHASSPERGVNAFTGMAELVHQLGAFEDGLGRRERVYRDFNGQERYPTLNMGGVFTGGPGDKINTVPARATFSIDRRVLPNERLAEAERELRTAIDQAARRAGGLRCRIRAPLRIGPCVVDPEHDLPRAFARAVRSVRRHAAGFGLTRGFTDLHYFVEEGRLPGVGYGVKGQRAHSVDERVEVRDLLQTARVYAQFMMEGIDGPC